MQYDLTSRESKNKLCFVSNTFPGKSHLCHIDIGLTTFQQTSKFHIHFVPPESHLNVSCPGKLTYQLDHAGEEKVLKDRMYSITVNATSLKLIFDPGCSFYGAKMFVSKFQGTDNSHYKMSSSIHNISLPKTNFTLSIPYKPGLYVIDHSTMVSGHARDEYYERNNYQLDMKHICRKESVSWDLRLMEITSMSNLKVSQVGQN